MTTRRDPLGRPEPRLPDGTLVSSWPPFIRWCRHLHTLDTKAQADYLLETFDIDRRHSLDPRDKRRRDFVTWSFLLRCGEQVEPERE